MNTLTHSRPPKILVIIIEVNKTRCIRLRFAATQNSFGTSHTTDLGLIGGVVLPCRNTPIATSGGHPCAQFTHSPAQHRGNRGNRGFFQRGFAAGSQPRGPKARFEHGAGSPRRNRVHREIHLHAEVEVRLAVGAGHATAARQAYPHFQERVNWTLAQAKEALKR